MSKRLFKTLVAVLAIAAAAAGPVRGQTTYNVTFGGFNNPNMNTTVNVASLPQTFTGVGVYDFYPFEVISDDCYEFTGASVTSGGEGKVSVNIPNWNSMTITVTGTFEGTATIHVVGEDNYENAISRDITVAFTLPPTPITVRMAAGTEEAANWTLASGNASVPGTQVLENVMSGSQVTATYSGTQKVKSVKAVKYVVPPTLLDNTTTAWTAGTYAVPAGGLTYSDAITVSGDVTLVLTDGETLTLNKGISLASGATLTVEGNGTMNVNGTNESTASTVAGTGTLVLTSGTLTATGGNGGSVDVVENDAHGGNGGVAINGSVIVSGGTLTARGGNGGSVDFQSANCSGGNGGAAISGSVTVNSGTLTATGGNGGSVGDYGNSCGGGAGSAAISGDLTINSGTETLTNGANGQLGQYTDECSAGTGSNAVAGTVTDNR